MRKITRTSLILAAFLMLFEGLSFGGQLQKEILPIKTSQEEISEQEILPQKGKLWFSSPAKAASEKSLYGAKPIKAIWSRGPSAPPEIAYPRQSPETTEVSQRDLSHFEDSLVSKGKSGYHSEKIPLTRTNLNPPKKFISSLSVARYKEENAPSWLSERFKEDDILKSLAIFFELQLKF